MSLTASLPLEIIREIFAFLGTRQLLLVQRVCGHWRKIIVSTVGIWQQLAINEWSVYVPKLSPKQICEHCLRAVLFTPQQQLPQQQNQQQDQEQDPVANSISEEQESQEHVCNLLIRGMSGTGKTCFVSRLLKNKFAQNHDPTQGIALHSRIYKHNIGKLMKLSFIDYAGKDGLLARTSPFAYRLQRTNHSCILFFYDVTDQAANLAAAESFIREAQLQFTPRHSPAIILVGTRVDLVAVQQTASGKRVFNRAILQQLTQLARPIAKRLNVLHVLQSSLDDFNTHLVFCLAANTFTLQTWNDKN